MTAECPLQKPGKDDGIQQGLFDSTSSLPFPLPRRPQDAKKRGLMLVYIHGLNGSEASFYNFPAHVHSLLTSILRDTHVVYTKIYPRYKSRGEMKIARDNFSNWLSPHESDDLDVILLGHSLGGILAAEVALLPGPCSSSTGRRKHRILGLVNFDVPFLGLHPRIIKTSISGLFQKRDPMAQAKPDEEQVSSEVDSEPLSQIDDPYYDPPFTNDVHLIERGRIHGIIHFLTKNADNLSRSILERVVSSYDFAGCLNNYIELFQRYQQVKALEAAENHECRVRFVNYYTASTGYLTTQAEKSEERPGIDKVQDENVHNPESVSPYSPRGQQDEKDPLQYSSTSTDLYQIPGSHCTHTACKACAHGWECLALRTDSSRLSCSSESDNGQCKSTTDEYSEKALTHNFHESQHYYRKFCLLPSHTRKNRDDSLWIPIEMSNMDEIVAHQSMFLPHSGKYDQLVGDTVFQIERWAQDDLTQRVLPTVG
ncbi:hypothetical protein BO70DRAFT_323286 [Aspergillus heteromorphus CBS 117.55]|uniref:AB hydrolase-1 domain-containing protein n=1 Tax=Aspergillus heteromorphus CBS 117.55 TaxID=1448321 RepID=A0A317V2X4_9EURO|nr:uncharacterized protein BO70DRAFT_323286 [Aspergillus heteromorphus CBS 117.55]PWY68435.1 hypothetical protein BO70DRAFT_323286 [Aspergillus heteromorphus CBS 117.55]